jgi:hypothetical protein
MEYNAPAEAIKLLVEACPEAVKENAADGWTPLHLGMRNKAPAEVIKLLVEACPEAVKERDKYGGYTPLHHGMEHKAPVEVIKLLVEACPEAVKEKNVSGDTPLQYGMIHNAPAEVIKLLVEACPEAVKVKDKDGNTPLHYGVKHKAPPALLALLRLHSILPAAAMAQHATPGASTFNASELKKGLAAMAGDRVDLSALHGTTDSHFNLAGMEKSLGATATTTTTATHYHQLLTAHHHTNPPSSTAPLSERLAPIKDVLLLCVQTELQFASPSLHTTCDLLPYQHL